MARLAMTYPDAGAQVLYLRQRSRELIRWLEIALAAARRLHDRQYEGAMLGNLGLAYKNLGEIRRAIQFCEEASLIEREIGDRRGEATALWNMSLVLYKLGERTRAIQRTEQALTIFEQIEDPHAGMVRKQLAAWREQTS
ncbi:MAG TPA: tetratricopeptide repeat protein [Pyrinomonadaceae bacterium]|nr:tetratricopeptide repeat protein [Pyrinomonadaceae bacterium]